MLFTAWSVSLNPKGGTFAATGGSGNVTIHSAEAETFGEQRTTLQSGRGKFGMRCSHVSVPLGLRSQINYSRFVESRRLSGSVIC
jgi:hypothetical protein